VRVVRLEARGAVPPIELRTYADERALLVGFEGYVRAEADPDVLLSYDARGIGLVADRHAALHGVTKGARGVKKGAATPKATAKEKAAAGGAAGSEGPFNLGRALGDATKVVSINTYSKAWVSKGGRQQTSENLETHEVVGCVGRYSLDALRAVVVHQTHKLTSYSFAQAIEAVLGEATEVIEPSVLAARTADGSCVVALERKARHLARQCGQLWALCGTLKTLEETVEMARLTGLPLRTIANQAQMVRTENLLLRAGRATGYVLPLSARKHALPPAVGWASADMPADTRAYQHWPWRWDDLDSEQQRSIEWGIAGHCSPHCAHSALQFELDGHTPIDGSTGLQDGPVAVLDFASLYPSVFIANNICFSTLMPPKYHDALATAHGMPYHRTPDTVGPNTRVPGAAAEAARQGEQGAGRLWPGSAIAFVQASQHEGLFPRLLRALLRERRAVKRRMKEVASSDGSLAAVLDARQLTLKLLANASYGFCGADTSHLCCKPLAEGCLRIGNGYCRLAARLIEGEGRGCTHGQPRWPQAAVVYANTDSVFVKLRGRTPAEAADIGREMAAYVSSHAEVPADLQLEYERVLSPCLLDAHNRYAGAEFVSGHEAAPRLHQKGLLERGQAPFIQAAILGMLQRLLLRADRAAALDYCRQAARELLAGEVASDQLVEGGFLKRADQKDLLRMAGLSDDKPTDDDNNLRKQNCVSLAIAQLQATAVDGRPTLVYRQGEWVPFLLANKAGGAAAANKQFENVMPPHEAVLRATPVSLQLLYTNRLIPALLGQVREASGAATKAAALDDKPVLLGRLLSRDERRAFRSGEHARRSYSGVLTCDEGWRLLGMAAPPPDGALDKRGGQGKISSFFGKRPAPPPSPPALPFASPSRAPSDAPWVADVADGADPPTPGAGSEQAAAEERRFEQEVRRLTAQRLEISRAAGHAEGEPLLLSNLASPLANATRLLAAARRRAQRA